MQVTFTRLFLSTQNHQEVELKLALLSTAASIVLRQLSLVRALGCRQPSRQRLRNIYFDTLKHNLWQQGVALRMRRVGSASKQQWRQTLKTGNRGDSALSQRGEWEVPVPGHKLTLDALQSTPWSQIDPDGEIFQALTPIFETNFERTSWSVQVADGSLIDVALDMGHILVGQKSEPICELELELRSGQPAALFDLAQHISRHLAVLPLSTGKAARGYAMRMGDLHKPIGAAPPRLSGHDSLRAAAACVLREMFCQFTTNLNTLRVSDDPEVVHQARVGWRRFRSALRLFKPALVDDPAPSWETLQPLLCSLSALRDIDVARIDTLPLLADVYSAGDSQRRDAWQSMMEALLRAGHQHRQSVRKALQRPIVGHTLLQISQWIEELASFSVPCQGNNHRNQRNDDLESWARRRVVHLHGQLKDARRDLSGANCAHRVRIHAKRLRYAITALQTLLPKRRAERWCQQAASLQLSLGATRDLVQAGVLVARLDLDQGLAEFLRGFAIGKA